MSGTKRLKRRRGRPVAMPDYLLVLFEIVEVEQYRTGLSINRVWQRIIKQRGGSLRLFKQSTGEGVVIRNARTLRSRYQEVLAALAGPRQSVAGIDDIESVREWAKICAESSESREIPDGLLLFRYEQVIDRRTGEPKKVTRYLGRWKETQEKLQARRQAVLHAQRKKLHNK